MLRTMGGQRFFDVNLRDPWVYTDRLHWSLQHADIVKANDNELDRIAQLLGVGGTSPEARANALMQRYQLRGVLITCDAAGAWWLDDSAPPVSISSEPMSDIRDSVGAGDAFSAVFMLGLLNSWTIPVTLQRAHSFAGSICQIRGAVPEHDDFYKRFMDEWFPDR